MVELQHNFWGCSKSKIWRAIASLEIFLAPPPPEALQKSHFWGSKCFSTAISVQKHLQIAIKHL